MYQYRHLPSGNSQVNPPPRTTDTPVELLPTAGHVDWIMDCLHKEMDSHNETRSTLQSCRQVNVQLERLLCQERSFNHNLRVSTQEAEMRRIAAEGRLRNYEQQIVRSFTTRGERS